MRANDYYRACPLNCELGLCSDEAPPPPTSKLISRRTSSRSWLKNVIPATVKKRNSPGSGSTGNRRFAAVITDRSSFSGRVRKQADPAGGERRWRIANAAHRSTFDEEIGILRAWIDQGADFRIQVQEEAAPRPMDPKSLPSFRQCARGRRRLVRS